MAIFSTTFNFCDNDNIGGIEKFEPILNSCKESIWKNRGINSGWNVGMVDTIMVNSTIMRIGMSPFSNPCCHLASISNFSILA